MSELDLEASHRGVMRRLERPAAEEFLGGDGEAHGSGEQLFVEGLVEDAGDVAVLIEMDSVAVVLQRRFRDFERRLPSCRFAEAHVEHGIADGGNLGDEEHFTAFELRRDFGAVGSEDVNGFRIAACKVEGGFCDVLTLDVERIENNDGCACGLRVESGGNAFGRGG
jgi:hypothetical protein